MKKLISSISILALVGLAVAVSVQGATEGSVTATVTVENVSVSVTDGTVDYGTLPVNTSSTTVDFDDTQTATNDGNITADLNIRGVDTANWTLEASAGSEQYKHEFSLNSGASYTALTTDNQSLATGVTASGSQAFDLRITTPTATVNFGEQSPNVTVQAVTAS